MALLTTDMQDKPTAPHRGRAGVGGRIASGKRKNQKTAKKPLFEPLADKHIIIDDEMLTHAAQLSGVHVNLTNSIITKRGLGTSARKSPSDSWRVPLALVQNRLTIAMVDVTNVPSCRLLVEPDRKAAQGLYGIRTCASSCA